MLILYYTLQDVHLGAARRGRAGPGGDGALAARRRHDRAHVSMLVIKHTASNVFYLIICVVNYFAASLLI